MLFSLSLGLIIPQPLYMLTKAISDKHIVDTLVNRQLIKVNQEWQQNNLSRNTDNSKIDLFNYTQVSYLL